MKSLSFLEDLPDKDHIGEEHNGNTEEFLHLEDVVEKDHVEEQLDNWLQVVVHRYSGSSVVLESLLLKQLVKQIEETSTSQDKPVLEREVSQERKTFLGY